VLLGRRGGPEFLDSELARLEQNLRHSPPGHGAGASGPRLGAWGLGGTGTAYAPTRGRRMSVQPDEPEQPADPFEPEAPAHVDPDAETIVHDEDADQEAVVDETDRDPGPPT
jgi:hypothetical protein